MRVFSIVKDGKKQKIKIPSTAEELTLYQMALFLDAVEEEKESSELIKNTNKLSDLNDELEFYTYSISVLRILSKTLNIDLASIIEEVQKKSNEELITQILTIFFQINKIINSYEPKVIKEFKYKGSTYNLKHTFKDVFSNERNPNLSLIEGILLFIAKDTYSKLESDSQTNFYNMVRIMLSIMARKKGFLKIEELPKSQPKIEEFTKKRAFYFKDIPYSIGMDFWFFFVN